MIGGNADWLLGFDLLGPLRLEVGHVDEPKAEVGDVGPLHRDDDVHALGLGEHRLSDNVLEQNPA